MAQPRGGASASRPKQAERAAETTQEIRRPAASVATKSDVTAPDLTKAAAGNDEGYSPPRLSRTSSLAAPQATPVGSAGRTDDDAPTQTLPKVESAAPAPGRPRPARSSGPRRARLQVRHIGPWTVLKFSSLLAIALFLVWLIAIGLLYGALNGAGVIGKINDTYTTISGSGSAPPVTTGLVFSGALVVGAVGAVLFVLLSTIGAIIYNLCADVVGGIELTLAERE